MKFKNMKNLLDESLDQSQILATYSSSSFHHGGYDVTYYFKGKQDATPILFIHGWINDASVWVPVAELLAQNYNVWIIDLPGHGKSGQIRKENYTIDLFTSVVKRLIKDVIQRKIWIVGHSMGGAITQKFVAESEQMVSGMVLVSTGLNFHTFLPSKLIELLIPGTFRFKSQMRFIAEVLTPKLYSNLDDHKIRLIERAVEIILDLPVEVALIPYSQVIKPWKNEDTSSRIPALIVCGDEDPLTALKSSIKLNIAYYNSYLKVIPKGTHMIPLTHFLEIAEYIDHFVAAFNSQDHT